MDNGEVLQGLDARWSFGGANAMEWLCGMVVFFFISFFASKPASAMPAMIAGWVFTTMSLAGLRRSFPDEERGVRNKFMTACGFPPIGIPLPAALQHTWSATPVREVPKFSNFKRLHFDQMFPSFKRDLFEEPESFE